MIFMHLSDFLINAQVEVLCVTRPSRDLSIVGVATPDYSDPTFKILSGYPYFTCCVVTPFSIPSLPPPTKKCTSSNRHYYVLFSAHLLSRFIMLDLPTCRQSGGVRIGGWSLVIEWRLFLETSTTFSQFLVG